MTKRSRLWTITQRIYDEVETGLWASLVAFVIFFCAFVVPDMPKNIENAQRNQEREIAEENAHYCEKWGKDRGTQGHMSCLLDLQELRNSVQKRIADATFF